MYYDVFLIICYVEILNLKVSNILSLYHPMCLDHNVNHTMKLSQKYIKQSNVRLTFLTLLFVGGNLKRTWIIPMFISTPIHLKITRF